MTVKSVGIPGTAQPVVKKRQRSRSPESAQKKQRLSTENKSSNGNPHLEDDTDWTSIKAPRASEDAHHPYTAQFFIDMVDTIANLFPLEVSQALSAVVVSLPMNPDLESLEDRCRVSMAEKGTRMMDRWQARYQYLIRPSSTGLDGTAEEHDTN
ncbi:hypothetical protein VTN02DRAFT_3715 [Thermoascus thermophilus]